jgi:hypothetical protein
MEICLDEIDGINEIPVAEFNVAQISRIKKEYGGLRQESKAPT